MRRIPEAHSIEMIAASLALVAALNGAQARIRRNTSSSVTVEGLALIGTFGDLIRSIGLGRPSSALTCL